VVTWSLKTAPSCTMTLGCQAPDNGKLQAYYVPEGWRAVLAEGVRMEEAGGAPHSTPSQGQGGREKDAQWRLLCWWGLL
jgi:hypothetical protein